MASEVDGERVDGFLGGAAGQASAFMYMGNPFIGVGGSVVLSYSPTDKSANKLYGGDSAFEYGFGTPGVNWAPITYGKRMDK